jgi:hypothetical protein
VYGHPLRGIAIEFGVANASKIAGESNYPIVSKCIFDAYEQVAKTLPAAEKFLGSKGSKSPHFARHVDTIDRYCAELIEFNRKALELVTGKGMYVLFWSM